jgi:lysyl-tRNA synthetase class 2
MRAEIMRAVRNWFEYEGFQEVETPILQVMPVADTHIHGFKTEALAPDLKHQRDLYLHTSPEFAMKKLLVAGMPKIFQLCHVFRNGEDSRLHSAEFTMLEWYRKGAGYRDVMKDCVNLVRAVAEAADIKKYIYRDKSADPFKEWEFITVAEAFQKYADINLENFLDDVVVFSKEITAKGIRVAKDDRWDDLFFRAMAEKIEPNLGVGVPTILYDYPVSMASLARRKPEDPRFAERFEMYVCGVELCNGFGELTDAAEQRKRFTEDMAQKKKLYGYTYPVDEDFLKALEHGLPQSSGNALGFDRLVMLATGSEEIDQVLWTGKP